jgi:hypothetical protein
LIFFTRDSISPRPTEPRLGNGQSSP